MFKLCAPIFKRRLSSLSMIMLNGCLIFVASLGALLVITHDCMAVNQCACIKPNPLVKCLKKGDIKCNSSATCAKGSVCCLDDCLGSQCVPLPGDQICTAPPKGMMGTCIEGCVNGCPTGMKCCSNGCGHTCRCPNETYTYEYFAERVHGGECPYMNLEFASPCFAPSTLVNHCRQDGECNDTQKCCTTRCDGLQCISPAPVVIKLGYCPKPLTCTTSRPAADVTSDSQENQCTSDGTCPDDQKCCLVPGTGNQCMYPDESSNVKMKRGDCPVLNRTVVRCANITDLCSDDGCCDADLKCCANACGVRICTAPAPVTVKAGDCGRTKSMRPGLICPKLTANDLSNACSSDGTCPKAQKCCNVWCKGLQCTDPAAE